MSENKLFENFKNFLPLNRKERFYTGTILPQIICYNNFQHLNRFLNLINGFPNDIIFKTNAESSNIQILTEYSLNESYRSRSGYKVFKSVPTTKETPDLVILITEPELLLIVVEAKMYSSCNAYEFKTQFSDQKKVVHCLKDNLCINEKNIFHFVLLPKNYFASDIHCEFQIISWEDILESYKDILSDNYFFNVLKIALSEYSALKSPSNAFSSIGKNMDDKLTGLKILERHNSGERFIVGRGEGLSGIRFQSDIAKGGWKTYPYEVKYQTTPVNRNWFTSTEFVNAVNIPLSHFDQTKKIESLGDWHFSHLGEDYFKKIALVVLNKYSLDVPIYQVYVGKSGEPYSLIRLGRDINPNWSVILKDGSQKKFNRLRKLEDGLWNKSNCNVYNWEDIKNYYSNQGSK